MPADRLLSHADLDFLLHAVVGRHAMPAWQQDLYVRHLLPDIQALVRSATHDRTCTLSVEGSVAHGTALKSADADLVVRNQTVCTTNPQRRALEEALKRHGFDSLRAAGWECLGWEVQEAEDGVAPTPANGVTVEQGRKSLGVTIKVQRLATDSSAADGGAAVEAVAAAATTDSATGLPAAQETAAAQSPLTSPPSPGTTDVPAPVILTMDILFENTTRGKLVNRPEARNPFEDEQAASCAAMALKLLRASRVQGFGGIKSCMLESLVLWQLSEARKRERECASAAQQQQQQQQGGGGGGGGGVAALGLLWRVLRALLPPSALHFEHLQRLDDCVSAMQPTVKVAGFADNGRYVACAQYASHLLVQFDKLLRQPAPGGEVDVENDPRWKALADRLDRILCPQRGSGSGPGAAGNGGGPMAAKDGQGQLEQEPKGKYKPPQTLSQLSPRRLRVLDILTGEAGSDATLGGEGSPSNGPGPGVGQTGSSTLGEGAATAAGDGTDSSLAGSSGALGGGACGDVSAGQAASFRGQSDGGGSSPEPRLGASSSPLLPQAFAPFAPAATGAPLPAPVAGSSVASPSPSPLSPDQPFLGNGGQEQTAVAEEAIGAQAERLPDGEGVTGLGARCISGSMGTARASPLALPPPPAWFHLLPPLPTWPQAQQQQPERQPAWQAAPEPVASPATAAAATDAPTCCTPPRASKHARLDAGPPAATSLPPNSRAPLAKAAPVTVSPRAPALAAAAAASARPQALAPPTEPDVAPEVAAAPPASAPSRHPAAAPPAPTPTAPASSARWPQAHASNANDTGRGSSGTPVLAPPTWAALLHQPFAGLPDLQASFFANCGSPPPPPVTQPAVALADGSLARGAAVPAPAAAAPTSAAAAPAPAAAAPAPAVPPPPPPPLQQGPSQPLFHAALPERGPIPEPGPESTNTPTLVPGGAAAGAAVARPPPDSSNAMTPASAPGPLRPAGSELQPSPAAGHAASTSPRPAAAKAAAAPDAAVAGAALEPASSALSPGRSSGGTDSTSGGAANGCLPAAACATAASPWLPLLRAPNPLLPGLLAEFLGRPAAPAPAATAATAAAEASACRSPTRQVVPPQRASGSGAQPGKHPEAVVAPPTGVAAAVPTAAAASVDPEARQLLQPHPVYESVRAAPSSLLQHAGGANPLVARLWSEFMAPAAALPPAHAVARE